MGCIADKVVNFQTLNKALHAEIGMETDFQSHAFSPGTRVSIGTFIRIFSQRSFFKQNLSLGFLSQDANAYKIHVLCRSLI